MQGYSPKLPLTLDPNDGFRLTKDLKEVTSQNLKMLVLTSPGERVMVPAFGVGLYNFLFELDTQNTHSSIRERITQQVKRYMPFVEIVQIDFGDSAVMDPDHNVLALSIKYRIIPLNSFGVLNVKVD